jgi:DNA-binding transcriptional MerR regulator
LEEQKTMYDSSVSDVTEERQLTIDALARRSRMTVRNIRAHQSRGLLPPPEIRGRTGYYGAEHQARLELIRELQDEGFNLEAIRRLLERANGSSAEVMRFTRAVREPFEDERPEVITAAELAQRFGEEADLQLLKRVFELGLARPLPDGNVEQRSPRLARAGDELRELGIPIATALDAIEVVRAHADGIAEEYIRLFLDEIWGPFEEAGRPAERWPEVAEALERLRPLAAESLAAVFGLAMSDATEKAFGREIERLGEGARLDAP